MSSDKKSSQKLKGRPIATDPNARSASTNHPAFVTPPVGAPVYYGFPVLEDVTVDGFTLGKITDFEAEFCDEGDAFVIAPDHSRAGLVWMVSKGDSFREVISFEIRRWGVWGVSFPHAMTSRDNARRNLEFILPKLKQKWKEWKSSGQA
jgi:hypothetical protein